MSELQAFFESAKLPVMSEVAQALVRTLNDPNATSAQVQAIISRDPVLTANLLRLANSAPVRAEPPDRLADHDQPLIGMSRIRALALSTGIKAAFRRFRAGPHGVLAFNMACAGFAQWLAAGVGIDPRRPGWEA